MFEMNIQKLFIPFVIPDFMTSFFITIDTP